MARNESVRMSSAQRDQLTQYGNGNFSAATRACIYIGLAATGANIAEYRSDIRRILVDAELATALVDALNGIIAGCRTPVGHLSYTPSPSSPPAAETSDSYAVGFEF